MAEVIFFAVTRQKTTQLRFINSNSSYTIRCCHHPEGQLGLGLV